MSCFCGIITRVNMEEFKVAIDTFSGPLDLMLHLIKEKELDLFDLDMEVLCDQYISYLNSMQEMHLEVASEYLVELATLVEYKSFQLLPEDPVELEDGYEEDPKDRLVKRLLEYQQFKEVSKQLEQMYEQRQTSFSKTMSFLDEYMNDDDSTNYEGNPMQLLKAMQRMLRRRTLHIPKTVNLTKKEISIEDRMLEVRSKLTSLGKQFRFEELLDDCEDVDTYIATFLAVLDLARMHTLAFNMDENDHIWFTRGGNIS